MTNTVFSNPHILGSVVVLLFCKQSSVTRPCTSLQAPLALARGLTGAVPVLNPRLCLLGAAVLWASLSTGCAVVSQAEREFLSDRIMQRQEDALEGGLESHDFPRREGSVGGSSGSGGGCGC